jgi:hypothetical protein
MHIGISPERKLFSTLRVLRSTMLDKESGSVPDSELE